MNGLFALTDHSVHDAHRTLVAGGFKTGLLLAETNLATLDVVLVVSVGSFNARSDELCDWPGIVVIFDSPVRCDSLVGLTMLDVRERTASFKYVFDRITPEFLVSQIQSAIDAEEEVMYHVKKSTMLPYLLNQTSSSQLDRIQTWKYSIKNVEVRDIALAKLIAWFFAPKPSLDNLRDKLMQILNLDKSKALDILFKDSKFDALKVATLQVKALRDADKAYSVDKVAEKHGVSAFDIRYLIHAHSKNQQTHTPEGGVTLEDMHKAARNKTPCPLTGKVAVDKEEKGKKNGGIGENIKAESD